MEHSLPLWVVEMIGILLLTFILIALLDIIKTLDRIDDRLRKANDADAHADHEVRQDSIRP
jgi:hypothetical protein